MKPRCIALLALLALSPAVFAAEVGIEFSGVLTADGKTRIALTDTASRSTSWVESGAVFNGYTVGRYDAREDAVFLRKNGEEIRLGLVASKTPEAPRPALSGTPGRTAPATPVSPPPVSVAAAPTPTAAPAAAAVSAAQLPSAATPATTPAQAASETSLHSVPASDSPVSTTVAATAPEPIAQTPTPTGRHLSGPSYRVQTGDTVESIALQHGVPTQQIRQLNPSLNSTSLRSGETIRIRPE